MAKETKENPVSGNAAMVEFPRDEWGFTSELRKIGLQTASAVRGNDEKQKLFLGTLRILAQHSLARLQSDAAEQIALGEEIEARAQSAYQRVASNGPAAE